MDNNDNNVYTNTDDTNSSTNNKGRNNNTDTNNDNATNNKPNNDTPPKIEPYYEPTRKQIIKQNRQKLQQQGPYQYFIKPTITHWKNKPIRSITEFAGALIIMYLIFTGLQAINYSLIFCESNQPQYNGNILETYQDFVKDQNQKTQEIQTKINTQKDYIPPKPDYINCTYQPKTLLNRPDNAKLLLKNLKKVILKQK